MNAGTSPLSARRGVIWLVVSAVAFGSLVVLIKAAVQAGVNAETALALRFTLATLIWWLILLFRRQLPQPGARQTLPALALGALVYAPNGLAYYLGTARVSGSLAAMAVAVVPIVVALLAWLLLRERLGWLGRMALVLAVGGGVLLAGAPEGRPDATALMLLGGSLFLYSLYIVVSTPVTRASSPPAVAAYVFAGASLMYWLWGGLTGRLDFGFAPAGWAAVFGLAVIPTVLAMLTFLAGVQIVGPTRAAIVGALEPVTGVLLSVLLLGDRPGVLQIAGGGLIVGAAVLVQWERVRERARQAAD